ncbi:hypothetical protein B5M47_00425 [candidate division CPR3 bacterium 4484_211]|uniref:Methyltransferase domain-containing protein n=1 Tax=candidate division CPR3 bacterium 4484_211 TaxID=1968527 RepID=A0A1W9NZ94_UNCC3|nr:MAG: hypothetical protein B5M47_00425 [candidate division CPR3 bacterium 4484_211]
MLATLILQGVILLTLGTATFLLIYSMLFGAPYAPSQKGVIEKMIKLGEIKQGTKVVDLGSGDGRLLIAVTRLGAEAHGYEINPFLFCWSKIRIKRARTKKALVHLKDFWRVNLSNYDVVFLFGTPLIMGRLEKKLQKELPHNARVVSNYFQFPNWPLSKKLGKVYCYVKN